MLPADIIDQVSPYLHKKRTPAALSKWLTLTKRLLKLNDYLPFIPFGSRGSVTFRQYERLANERIQQLRTLLDNNPRAQRLARIGRAFRDRILKRQAFVWEGISSGELSKLPDDTLLHLLTIRRGAESVSTKPDSVGKQCDLCEDEICNLFTFGKELASRQPTSPAGEHDGGWERAASPDTTVQHHSNIATRCRSFQTWTTETSPSASTSLQAIDHNSSVVPLTSVDNYSASLHIPTCDASWSVEYTRVPDTGPQLQLALPRRVPDTAQSIAFAMNGDIDGLKYLFGLGLASPRDESHRRGFSLVRVRLSSYPILSLLRNS